MQHLTLPKIGTIKIGDYKPAIPAGALAAGVVMGLVFLSRGMITAERLTREFGPVEMLEAFFYLLAAFGALGQWWRYGQQRRGWLSPWLPATVLGFAIFAKEMEWENLLVPAPSEVPFLSLKVLRSPLLSLPHRMALVGLWVLLAAMVLYFLWAVGPKVLAGWRKGEFWAIAFVTFAVLLIAAQVPDKSKVWLPWLMGEEVRHGALNEIRRIVSQSFEESFELLASIALFVAVALKAHHKAPDSLAP